MIAGRGLPQLELLRTSVPPFRPKIYRQSLVRNPGILPREPPGQAMAVMRGSCRGQALRCPHMLHPVNPKSSDVHPYPRRPPAYETTLPAAIGCRKSRSMWAVWFCCTILTTLEHILPLPKFTVRVKDARRRPVNGGRPAAKGAKPIFPR